ncbi:MAG: hypothetical protein JNL21_08045, partial [Myxococcales bacterium]|nr:hypothetical protein [Myxococcales bacterium]
GVAAAQGEDDDTEPLVVAAPDEDPEAAPSAPPAVAATRVPPPATATPTPATPTPTPTPNPACPPPPTDTWSTRDPIEFTGSLYVLSGVAIDDFRDAGFLVRPSLDFGVSFGLGDVSLFTTASVLAIEAARFSNRTTTSVPALLTLGIKGESWTLAGAMGISAAVDNDYGDRPDNEESLVSPRGEVKAGYRFEDIVEVLGHVGLERRRFDNRDDQDRLLVGVSVGVAGH